MVLDHNVGALEAAYTALQSERNALKARVDELEAKVTERDNYAAMTRNKFEEHKGVLRGAVKDLESEVARLRSGGCARDQGTTQYCAEAVEAQGYNNTLARKVEHLESEVDIQRAKVARLRELVRAAYGDGWDARECNEYETEQDSWNQSYIKKTLEGGAK